MSTETKDYRIRRIQRWIGAKETGDLNSPETLDELENDLPGFSDYLTSQRANTLLSVPELVKREFPLVKHSTPNHGGRIDTIGVVFHHSCGSLSGSLDWISQSRSKVSYNMMIGEDGSQHQILPFDVRAWHAGKSVFQGRSGCNGFMTGIAFSGDTYRRRLTDAEIQSAVSVVKANAHKYGWKYETMTDHRTVSPGRKNDLNPTEWRRLQLALKSAF